MREAQRFWYRNNRRHKSQHSVLNTMWCGRYLHEACSKATQFLQAPEVEGRGRWDVHDLLEVIGCDWGTQFLGEILWNHGMNGMACMASAPEATLKLTQASLKASLRRPWSPGQTGPRRWKGSRADRRPWPRGRRDYLPDPRDPISRCMSRCLTEWSPVRNSLW